MEVLRREPRTSTEWRRSGGSRRVITEIVSKAARPVMLVVSHQQRN